ncbi:metallophosphoesterase [Falsiroseomonas sp. E2-1-a20]|uniref:metallophosphoesterase n=1 Tax=Falsiroseomonas sp. E2-1-a20 TaxID=3239300 RepID=UPI003F3CA856
MHSKSLRSPAPATAPASLPPGHRIYAIGDTHGCADRLAALHEQILEDLAAHPVAAPLVLHLGDHVDRGPDSAAVLDMLRQPLRGLPAINLMGNHDRMMLDALAPGAPADAVALWLANGGSATLDSYGASASDPDSWQKVSSSHLAWLRDCRTSFLAGGYLFAHAGIRPGRPLADQVEADLLWIREPFLSWPRPLPAVVVHGHTPAEAPEVLRHRIGLDTGAVYGGRLTCGVLEGAGIRFLFG